MGISLKGFGKESASGSGASISGLSALPPAAAAIRLAEPTTGPVYDYTDYWVAFRASTFDTTFLTSPTYATYSNGNLTVALTDSISGEASTVGFTNLRKNAVWL